ncbi:hypothetical protein F4680DRAFT_451218 [Xylaria scruposa]|nr:hypothetical protein F4680DRAFT_451218 [Xylaria scruposa]
MPVDKVPRDEILLALVDWTAASNSKSSGGSGREVQDEKDGATKRTRTAVPIITLSIPPAITRLIPPTPQSFRTRSNSSIEAAVNMKTTTITSIIFGLAALAAALPTGKPKGDIDVADAFKRSNDEIDVADAFKRSDSEIDVADAFKRSKD